MLLNTISSKGLAHHSYLVGDQAECAVIDPSRDVDRYLDAAAAAGCRISLVFETHRNEDYISGAQDLARRTGAVVWRGESPDYNVPYARVISEGQAFGFGDVRLTTLRTPGHTDDSISIVLRHLATGDDPIGVFTGDALFVGDVGRADFYPDRAREVAGLLHDSLQKLLTLGDSAIVYPAHGAGSVCGSGMARRELTTIGYERANNPKLQLDRDAFIQAKLGEHHEMPPYFRRMEQANAHGPSPLERLPDVQATTVNAASEALERGAQLLDLRNDQAIAGASIREAIAVPSDMLASFGGWFLRDDRPIVLLLDRSSDLQEVVRTLVRLGYDDVSASVAGGFEAWSTAARPVQPIDGLDVHELKRRLASREPPVLLDVRAPDEFESGHIESARHVYVGRVAEAVDSLRTARQIVTFCGTGRRALIAAAALRRLGLDDVAVCWGSMKAWKAAGYPVTGAKPQ